MFSENKIEIIQGDITHVSVDVIVNAANRRLLGGGGVDGAIHRAAGPELRKACAWLPEIKPGIRCEVGDVRLTAGFALPAHYVIHAVGPVWKGGYYDEDEQLKECYQRSFVLAEKLRARSIAFPIISGGAYGYPIKEALNVAITTMVECASSYSNLERIVLVCFLERDFELAKQTFRRFEPESERL